LLIIVFRRVQGADEARDNGRDVARKHFKRNAADEDLTVFYVSLVPSVRRNKCWAS
jgi:hypothetical protein